MFIKERDVTKPIQEENASQENRWEYVLANPGGSSIPAFLPAASALLALALHRILPMNAQFMEKPLPYYTLFMGASFVVFLGLACLSFFNRGLRRWLLHKSYFFAVLYLLIDLYNLVTLKWNLIPSLFFAYPDKILAVYYNDCFFLLRCVGHSLGLLFTGAFIGVTTGVLTGIAVGWSPRVHYWVQPFIKCIGPIPSTAWIPIALIVYPTTFSASAFLIALAVWFPTTVLTSSGIQNVEKSYFEVASILGAGTGRQILRVAIPGAMPSMFIGFFNGTCTAFLALMSAEMLGVKFGLGWYINWKREVMEYANVYAGLILIAIICSLLLTLLFKARARALKWQRGLIRW